MSEKTPKKIIRDPSEKITPAILNKFEIARIITILAQQIADGREFDQDILDEIPGEKDMNIEIAMRELELGITNLIIYRPIGDNVVEEWYVDEMQFYEY
jgi:DNA-directed RNA polymerase subunit K/omega